MADIEQYKKAILDAHNSGDFEGAQILADRLKTLQAAQTEPSLSDQALGVAETAGTVLSGIAAEPIAGIAGIAQSINPFADEGAGAEAVEATREALTYQPRTDTGIEYLKNVGETLQPVGEAIEGAEKYLGDKAYDITGSPAAAAAATAIPTALGELVGAGTGSRAVRGARRAEKVAQEALDQASDLRSGVSSERTISTGVETLQEGTPEQITEMMRLDPEFFAAADELGITTEPLAAFASESSQFRDISGALRSVPGSVLDVQARDFIKATSDAADNLIQQYGGTLDKVELGQRFKRESLANIDNLADQADEMYSSLRQQLPPQTRVNPESTLQFLREKADEFGGVDELPSELRRVYDSLSKDNGPTLGLVDQIRKDFGQATRKGTGRFKDAESGLAKAMYARLSSDFDAVAEQAGLQEVTTAAKEIVKKRKLLEDNLTALYGKDLNKSLGNVMSGAVKGLEKGRVDEFTSIIKSIPKANRQEAVLSYMNEVFKGTGANQQALNPTQFSKWYETISRSPTAKGALYANLPKDSRKAIDNLYKVSKGISRSQAQTVKTGAINSMFNNDTGFIRRMLGDTAARVASTALGGPVGSMAFDATREFFGQKTNAAKRASDLMSSPQFQKMVRDAVRDGVVDGAQMTDRVRKAEEKLMKTQKYRKWAESLSADNKAALAGGLVPYLFTEVGQQETSTQEGQ